MYLHFGEDGERERGEMGSTGSFAWLLYLQGGGWGGWFLSSSYPLLPPGSGWALSEDTEGRAKHGRGVEPVWGQKQTVPLLGEAWPGLLLGLCFVLPGPTTSLARGAVLLCCGLVADKNRVMSSTGLCPSLSCHSLTTLVPRAAPKGHQLESDCRPGLLFYHSLVTHSVPLFHFWLFLSPKWEEFSSVTLL